MTTVGLISLGCSKNKVDAEVMLSALVEGGFSPVTDPAEAEVIIVNTCGFIDAAKQESVNAILEMADYKEIGRCRVLAVSGCLSGRYGRELAAEMPEVDVWMGVSQYPRAAALLTRALGGEWIFECARDDSVVGGGSRILTTAPWQAYLKIAEGCDNCCSYCAIPAIRGPYRSRSLESLTAEAETLAAQGVKELILVAQDTTRYGTDLYGRPMLTVLLERLHALPFTWLRVLYCYPEMVDDALLDTFVRLPKLCPYLDIPLQHSEDRELYAMNRRTNGEEIRWLMEKIRRLPREMTLRTTLICGFPGETEEAAAAMRRFIREEPFDNLGAFAFSAEEGTVAAELPGQLPEEEKGRRLDALMRAQQPIALERNQRHVGKPCTVLLEELLPDGRWQGRTAFQAPLVDGITKVSGITGYGAGQFVQVRITAADTYDLEGVYTP